MKDGTGSSVDDGPHWIAAGHVPAGIVPTLPPGVTGPARGVRSAGRSPGPSQAADGERGLVVTRPGISSPVSLTMNALVVAFLASESMPALADESLTTDLDSDTERSVDPSEEESAD